MAEPIRSDPTLLNPAERRVLAMLAQGHTAKSIADELDLSVYAVNERLREARRKTGAGSSCELARRLAMGGSPENRDEIVEMAPEPGTAQLAAEPPHGARLRLGVPLMILAALFALAALSSIQAGAPVKDALLGPLLNQVGPDPRELHARVRAEPRDKAAEEIVRARYRTVPSLAHAATLRVICGPRLCEVASDVTNGHDLVAIQRIGLGGLQAAGYDSLYFEVGAGKTRPAFVSYLKRVRRTS